MIDFFSSWAEQIVLAVIIVTIIELILPNNKNKKYIQMVMGIYILFNIISPIIENKEVFSFDGYKNSIYISSSGNVIDQTSMDERIEKIYLEELEVNITEVFEENEYEVLKCEVDAELDSNDKNAGIHLISVTIKNSDRNSEIGEITQSIIEEYEIDSSKIKILIKN